VQLSTREQLGALRPAAPGFLHSFETQTHHTMVDRPGPAATTRWPLLNKQHSAHPRTDQARLDVADPAENNQPSN
jgi:hypothetical protein